MQLHWHPDLASKFHDGSHGFNTWADIIDRATLGMEVMHECKNTLRSTSMLQVAFR